MKKIKLMIYVLLICLLSTNIFSFSLGINCDNFDKQLSNAKFRKFLKKLKVDFIVWHISPQEEINYKKELYKIVKFCRRNNIKYLFNLEVVNYMEDIPYFIHEDGTKRWDLNKKILEWLDNDELFLGVVYDEAMLMQMLNHSKINGKEIKPYFVETKEMNVAKAYEAVVKKIKELKNYYASYNKRMVFEMVFPAYAHAVARAGGTLAPKLLKENFNDLMYYFYSGAAREYNHQELWANIDLWFHDKFPFNGKYGKDGSYHTPQQLYDALKFSYEKGFDYVYIEHVKALHDENFNITEYGKIFLKFKHDKSNFKQISWKSFKPQYVIQMFPYGYWGQKYSLFNPYHPYGSYKDNVTLKEGNLKFLKLLNKFSKGKIPEEADNWNALFHPYFQKTKYFMYANLPKFIVCDHLMKSLPEASIKTFKLYNDF